MIFQSKLKPGKGTARYLECLIHLFSIKITVFVFNPLSDNLAKWTDIETIHWQKPTNCLSVFDHFVGLALKGYLPRWIYMQIFYIHILVIVFTLRYWKYFFFCNLKGIKSSFQQKNNLKLKIWKHKISLLLNRCINMGQLFSSNLILIVGFHPWKFYLFYATDHFWYPLKKSENQRFSDVFKGH